MLDVTQLEILVASRELIPVEDHLFLCIHRTPAPAVDLVVEAFHRPGVCPPALEVDRGRRVGLLNPADDLVIEPVLEVRDFPHDAVGVRIFSFQVGEDLGVLLIPKPVERVEAPVSVGL